MNGTTVGTLSAIGAITLVVIATKPDAQAVLEALILIAGLGGYHTLKSTAAASP